ncbi:RNA-dependent DNA polymerase [candidate division KSB1 bacterium]|nr:RNA-dependent DNA polymerase [candidate division KSB1 bacterium]
MYNELTSWNNLLLAYKKASAGKRGHPNVAAFEYRLEDNLLRLQEELRVKTYRPGKYDSFYIHEPKRRLISAADFRDRVVHHALCNVIAPIFERSFIFDSYANRVGKGTHRALNRCQEFARGYKFAMPLDLRQFFPSIDYAILHATLARKISDLEVMWLIDLILASGEGVLREAYDMVSFPGDDLFAALRPRGLPIGNLASQFWANVYLNAFDHFVKRELRCQAYLRYVDDLLFFDDDKAILWSWKPRIEERLAASRVTIHPGAHPRPVSEGIPFLGFMVYPQRRRLKRRKGIYFQRKLRDLRATYRTGEISLAELTASVRGWINHVRYGNTVGLRKAMLNRPFSSSWNPSLLSAQSAKSAYKNGEILMNYKERSEHETRPQRSLPLRQRQEVQKVLLGKR